MLLIVQGAAGLPWHGSQSCWFSGNGSNEGQRELVELECQAAGGCTELGWRLLTLQVLLLSTLEGFK